MLDILAITGPIYFTIALGYTCTRLGVFARSEMRVFGKFVINLALPALLFNALARRNIGEILNGSYLLAYALGTLSLITIVLFWCRRRAGLDASDSAVYVMGMACSNSSFVGYPILLLTLAPVAGVALALNTIVENVLVIPLLLALAEQGREGSGHWSVVLRQTLQRLARHPMIIALAAGFCMSLSGWGLPEPVARTVNLFAVCSGALSLFVIGGTLVGLPMRGMGRQVATIAAGKLLAHPLAVLLAALALPLLGLAPLDPALRMAAVLLAAMPTMSIYPILAQAYGREDRSAAALLITTIASFFTLSALFWLGEHLPALV
jgi:malonate transporter and related proteins